jgi:hypothetical protein
LEDGRTTKVFKESTFVPIYRRDMKLNGTLIEAQHFYDLHTNFLQYPSLKIKYLQMKLLVFITVGFDITGHLLIRNFAFARYRRKNWSTMGQYISYSQTSRKPVSH